MKIMTKVKLTTAGLVGIGLATSFMADELGYGLRPETQEVYTKALGEAVDTSMLEQRAFNIGRFTMDKTEGSHLTLDNIVGAQAEMVRRTGHQLNEDPRIDAMAACAITLVNVPNSPTDLPPMAYTYYKTGPDQNYLAAEQLCLESTAAAITDGRINRIYSPETVTE